MMLPVVRVALALVLDFPTIELQAADLQAVDLQAVDLLGMEIPVRAVLIRIPKVLMKMIQILPHRATFGKLWNRRQEIRVILSIFQICPINNYNT
jgi:hypothetical protein